MPYEWFTGAFSRVALWPPSALEAGNGQPFVAVGRPVNPSDDGVK